MSIEIEYNLSGAVKDYGMFTELGTPQFMPWLSLPVKTD